VYQYVGKFLGFINSLVDVIPLERLHIRHLQSFFLLQSSPLSQNWDFPLLLDQVRQSVSMVDSRGQRPLWSLSNEAFAVENPLYGHFYDRPGCLSLRTAGKISIHQYARDESRSACSFGFPTPIQGSGDMSVDRQLHVVAYIINQGGTKSQTLCSLSQVLLLFCQNNILLLVRNVPGKLNVSADTLSRAHKPVLTECSIRFVWFGIVPT